jgi:hypothetical protein
MLANDRGYLSLANRGPSITLRTNFKCSALAVTFSFLEKASAAKGVASVSGLILHASVDFLRPKDLLTVGNSKCTTSRIAFGSSPSRARTSAKKD